MLFYHYITYKGPFIIEVGGGGGGGGGESGGPSVFLDGIWGAIKCQKMSLGGSSSFFK